MRIPDFPALVLDPAGLAAGLAIAVAGASAQTPPLAPPACQSGEYRQFDF